MKKKKEKGGKSSRDKAERHNFVPFISPTSYINFPTRMQQRQLRKMSQPLTILLCSALSLFFHGALSSTVVVDGVSEWKDPTVHVGDIVGEFSKPFLHDSSPAADKP